MCTGSTREGIHLSYFPESTSAFLSGPAEVKLFNYEPSTAKKKPA